MSLDRGRDTGLFSADTRVSVFLFLDMYPEASQQFDGKSQNDLQSVAVSRAVSF